jgi:hypothetical protein
LTIALASLASEREVVFSIALPSLARSLAHSLHRPQDDEETIRKWVPGTFASVEKTPAFEPFQTRAGRRTMRFINNSLREFRFENNLGKSKMCRNWKDLEDGSIMENLMLHFSRKDPKLQTPLMEGITKLQEHEEAMTKKHVEPVSKEFYDSNPQVIKCWSLLK